MVVSYAPAASDTEPSVSADTTSTSDPQTQAEGTQVGGDIAERVLAAWDALRTLLLAARGLLVALTDLARSELRLARASVPWVIGFAIVLVGLALSLWLSVMALIAWALVVATGSVGWALLGLVVLHVLGLIGVVWAFKRSARLLTFPATRAEVHGLFARPHEQRERRS